jgi:hypothetical protein
MEPGGAGNATEGIVPATQDGDTGFHITQRRDATMPSKKGPADSVVYDMSHLPEGFVPMGTLTTSGGATPFYGYVDRAFHRGDLHHGRFRCGGRLFVHKDDVDRLRNEFDARTAEPAKPSSGSKSKRHVNEYSSRQLESVCESLADIATSLAGVERLLDRLASAVENIATQPKTPQQELLHTFSSNGFHS